VRSAQPTASGGSVNAAVRHPSHGAAVPSSNGSSARGMLKSSSVSTLFAAATLSDAGGAGAGAGPGAGGGQFRQWGGNQGPTQLAAFDQGADVSAASLLLGQETTQPLSARSLHGAGSLEHSGSAGAELPASAAAAREPVGPVHRQGSRSSRGGSVGGEGIRRGASVQDLASVSFQKSGAGVSKPSAAKGAVRASNRRANSRYAKEKAKDTVAKEVAAEGAARAMEPPPPAARETGAPEGKSQAEMQEVGITLIVFPVCFSLCS
jgi:hypothetical protein